MNCAKLNMRGFTHSMLMMAFVVIFAVAGVGYIVAGHALSKHGPKHSNTNGASKPAKATAQAASKAAKKSKVKPDKKTKSGKVVKGKKVTGASQRKKAKTPVAKKFAGGKTCKDQSLKQAIKSNLCVRYMQTILDDDGFAIASINGIYNSDTTAAVKDFQTKYNAKYSVKNNPSDGTLGFQSWRYLCLFAKQVDDARITADATALATALADDPEGVDASDPTTYDSVPQTSTAAISAFGSAGCLDVVSSAPHAGDPAVVEVDEFGDPQF